MKKLMVILALTTAAACNSNGSRTENDVTGNKDQNISPNQTVPEEEAMKKDSTSGDIVGKDTTLNKTR